MDEYFLYIWDDDFLTSWTSGLAVAVAKSKRRAIRQILDQILEDGYEKDDHTYRQAGRDLIINEPRIVPIPGAAWKSGGD